MRLLLAAIVITMVGMLALSSIALYSDDHGFALSVSLFVVFCGALYVTNINVVDDDDDDAWDDSDQ